MTRLLPVLVIAAFGLVACSETSDRDQAIDGLERANGAAALESEMAALVENTPPEIETAVGDIDARAESLLASADTGKGYDEEIASSVTDTRGAGEVLVAAAGEPAKLDSARSIAAGKLTSSNESLSSATRLIGEDLADEQGNLSAADAETLALTVDTVDQSGEAVTAATNSVGQKNCLAKLPGTLQAVPIEIVRGFIECAVAERVYLTYRTTDGYTGQWQCLLRNEATGSGYTNLVTRCTWLQGDGEFVATETTREPPCANGDEVCGQGGQP